MSEAPRPPFLPGNLEEFTEHATNHYSEWFEYYRLAYVYIEGTEPALVEAKEQANQSNLKFQASEREVNHLKEKLDALHREYEKTQARDQGIRDYQEELLQKMQQKYLDVLKERDQAINLTTPTLLRWKRLRLLIPSLPAPPDFPNASPILTDLRVTAGTSADLSPKFMKK